MSKKSLKRSAAGRVSGQESLVLATGGQNERFLPANKIRPGEMYSAFSSERIVLCSQVSDRGRNGAGFRLP